LLALESSACARHLAETLGGNRKRRETENLLKTALAETAAKISARALALATR